MRLCRSKDRNAFEVFLSYEYVLSLFGMRPAGQIHILYTIQYTSHVEGSVPRPKYSVYRKR